MSHSKKLHALGWLSALVFAANAVHAAELATEWPSKSVRVIIPYAPGGSADLLGRLVGQQLAETFKQNFVSDNRPGATGIVGSELAAKAAPDGYTLLVSGVGSHVYVPGMMKVPYDPITDFTHIALLGGPPGVIVVNGNSAVRDLAGLIALAKDKPLSFGSAGTGTSGHLIAERFMQLAKIRMTHIPYKGAGPAVIDVRGGHIPVATTTLVAAASQIKSGGLRALSISSNTRVKSFPDVPTFTEAGFPVLATTWFSLSGPPRMPAPLASRINQAVRHAMRNSPLRERLSDEAIEANDMDPAQFTAFMRNEIAVWMPVVKSAAAAGAQ